MKNLLFLMLLALSSKASAQEKPTKEEFLNEIVEQLTDYPFAFFYLYNTTVNIDRKRYFTEEDSIYTAIKSIKNFSFKSFKQLDKIDSVFLKLKQEATVDTASDLWDCEKIRKAVCVDEERTKAILDSIKPVFYIVDWSDEKIAEAHQINRFSKYLSKNWTKQKADSISEKRRGEQNKIPYAYKTIKRFSKPVFDSNNEFALILMEASWGDSMPAGGGLFLFRKVKGKWKLIEGRNTWAK